MILINVRIFLLNLNTNTKIKVRIKKDFADIATEDAQLFTF